MPLDNIAVRWPTTTDSYEPVDPAEFVEFADLATRIPPHAAPAAELASTIAKTSTVRVDRYTHLVDLLLGLSGVLAATDAAAEDEDPVIDPDGCGWIAGGLERFVDGHRDLGHAVNLETVGQTMRNAIAGARLADQQLVWLQTRLDALSGPHGPAAGWNFPLAEITVLAMFYRTCADRGFAIFASLVD